MLEAQENPAAFLSKRVGLVSPVPLAITKMDVGWFLHAASEPVDEATGYLFQNEELSDAELEVVCAGSPAYGPTTTPTTAST